MAADPRVDAYIARQAASIRAVLTHLRGLVHAASPDMEETVKWGMPFFTRRGQALCYMAGFKAHAAFGFWHDKVVRKGVDGGARDDAMGQFGRITCIADLPPDARIAALLARAMALIDAGDKPRSGPRQPRAPLPVHPDFAAALIAAPSAAAAWSVFPPGKVRDYCEWINNAKTDATRTRRIARSIEWIAQGKGRNWKYGKC